MSEDNSLCRVDWKLGQALMPDHFLWQEESLRREWEQRFSYQSLPSWGVAALRWDDDELRTSGRLLVTTLQLVFETGLLVDIPRNARKVFVDLPEKAEEAVDVFIHLESSPEIVKGSWADHEGNRVELRQQKLVMALGKPLKTPQPGFHLARFRPIKPEDGGPDKVATGWEWDPSYVPPLVSVWGLPNFAEARFRYLSKALKRWVDLLKRQAGENSLAVHKRVEAQFYLRRAWALEWFVRQIAPTLPPEDASSVSGRDRRQTPAIKAHPFELYQRSVGLYLDIFTYRSTPLQLLDRHNPLDSLYRHEELAECFQKVEKAITHELKKPGPGSPEWSFQSDKLDRERWICDLPKGLREDAELYFLVQFEGRDAETHETEDGMDRRLLGVKLAAPGERSASVARRVLPGIPLERVRLVPFPHNFDPTTVQFYRLKAGPEWTWAYKAGKVGFYPGQRPIHRAFLYSPDVVGG